MVEEKKIGDQEYFQKIQGLIHGVDFKNIFQLPKNYRLYLATEHEYLRIYKGKLSGCWNSEEHYSHKNLNLDRGKLLDRFAHMEFLVNEIMILHILGRNYDNSYLLEDLLVNVDLFSRIRLLFDWTLIDQNTKELLLQLKNPRNQLAHSFGVDEVKYKNKNLELNFNEFKQDLSDALKQLYNLYFKKFKENFDLFHLEEELLSRKIIKPLEMIPIVQDYENLDKDK